MGKIEFIEERCFGCGACWSVAPENFTCNDEGRTTMISDEANEAAIEASEICPASAIIVEGACDCCDCENCNCDDENTECDCNHECSCGENCTCTEEDNCGCLDKCTCGDDCNCTDECNCGCK